jgi:two-component system, chemotaxis family, chemotaxis protein CheY
MREAKKWILVKQRESAMSVKRVLSVGQCGADHGSISRTLQKAFGVEVVAADSMTEALEQLREQSFALVLVNRIFDRDGSTGLDLIRQIKNSAEVSQVPIMLVSNYQDAQENAVKAGALPGFGKASLGRPQMLERVGALFREQTIISSSKPHEAGPG